MENVDALGPAAMPVPFHAGTIDVLPIEVGQIPAVIRKARPVIASILDLENLPEDGNDGAMVDLALDMIEQHGDAVFESIALLIGREASEVKKLNIGQFVVLAKSVFEVNRDFFRDHLAPLLARVRGSAESPSTGAGKTASTS